MTDREHAHASAAILAASFKSVYRTTEPLDTLLPALHVIRVLEGLWLEREVPE